ncbi:MAG: class I SAM-dependent methyltransferase [Desulfobacterales bacterium]|nr:class I SAM-dependent methyltransferase [Desulfobacterales bacterium]
MHDPHPCPLCRSLSTEWFRQDRRREYYRCRTCLLVFVKPDRFLPRDAEKAEYNLHQNSPTDPGYRKFLSRLFLPLREHLSPGARGLDFGCGPGPTLSVMFEEAGHAVALYDPFYAPDTSVLDNTYDFITASEVVEHLHRPGEELDRLWERLKPSGILGVMTQMVIDQEAFSRWRYKNDMTHVCFFSRETFAWLAARWQAEMIVADTDVILFLKSAGAQPPD